MKKVIVNTTKYEDSDGRRHNTPEQANKAQAIIDGHARICSVCNGTKSYKSEDSMGRHYDCNNCDSDGMVWKTIMWTKNKPKNI